MEARFGEPYLRLCTGTRQPPNAGSGGNIGANTESLAEEQFAPRMISTQRCSRAPNRPARGLGITRTSIIVHMCCLHFPSHGNLRVIIRRQIICAHTVLCTRVSAHTLHGTHAQEGAPRPGRRAWLTPTGEDRRPRGGRTRSLYLLKKSLRENPLQPPRFFVVAALCRTEVGSQARVPLGETAGTKGSRPVAGFKQRPRSGSRGTGGATPHGAGLAASPPPPGRSQVGPDGPRAGAPRAAELCLFSSYSWLPSTRLFVAAKGTSGRAGALGGGVGVPLPGPTSFMASELRGQNYRRNQNV